MRLPSQRNPRSGRNTVLPPAPRWCFHTPGPALDSGGDLAEPAWGPPIGQATARISTGGVIHVRSRHPGAIHFALPARRTSVGLLEDSLKADPQRSNREHGRRRGEPQHGWVTPFSGLPSCFWVMR